MSYDEVRHTGKQTAQESHCRNKKTISYKTVSTRSLKETQVGKSAQMSEACMSAQASQSGQSKKTQSESKQVC